MSTGERYFVDAEGELLPPVHTEGAFCGRLVPRGGFCPQADGILWQFMAQIFGNSQNTRNFTCCLEWGIVLKFFFRYLLLGLCLVAAQGLFGQQVEYVVRADTVSAEIHFRWDKHFLDTLYLGNDASFRRIASSIDSIGLHRVSAINIVSQSSPEGPLYYNERLSGRRAATMRKYMVSHYPALADVIVVDPDGESWLQLRKYVANDTYLSARDRERIVYLIDNKNIPLESKKKILAKSPFYRYLYRTYYPVIRNSRIQIISNDSTQKVIPPAVAVGFVPAQMNSPVASVCRYEPPVTDFVESFARDTMVVAFKTNLLYDLVSVLNCEIEVPIGNHYSVMVEDVFPWWEKGNKYCLQMWEMGIEGRYWFNENNFKSEKLTGRFLGAYVMSSKFDFQWDWDLCYQGEYWSAGVTYGFARRLNNSFNLEFSVSVGYLSSAYRHYYPHHDYELLWRDKYKTGRVSYVGPTKLKVSLVYPLRIKYNRRGGGR